MVLRVGFICTAAIGKKNALAVAAADDVELTVVGSRSLENAQKYLKALQSKGAAMDAIAVGSYEEVLTSDKVDCVYMPLPTGLHAEFVARAAENGKHVLLEKPIALDWESLRSITSTMRTAGLQLMDGTMWTHHKRTAKMRSVLDSGTIGKIRRIHVSVSFTAPDSFLKEDIRCHPGLDGLGALGDIGWYCIRAILWAMDFALPDRIAASPLCKRNAEGVVMSCSAVLDFGGDVTASFDCAFDTVYRARLTIAGTEGELICPDFMIPHEQLDSSGYFVRTDSHLTDWDLHCTDSVQHEKVESKAQEALMFEAMAATVADGPQKMWFDIAEKTQLCLLAVLDSLNDDGKVIEYKGWRAGLAE